MSREKRSFKMHKQLLVDIIKRQAGSLWKATIEGIMNAIDAGASTCKIELTQEMLIIRDNGKGFRSRDDIENFFEHFGKPHAAREQKTFGRFRMGRGQLFAFGHNIWRSGTFEMTINIERDGLDYHLQDGLDRYDGCTITVELYKPLTHTQFSRVVDEIKANAKYVRIATTLNGHKFGQNLSQMTWDLELPEADIRFRQNQDLRVYNQGIRVMTYYRQSFGVGGDIVTKKPIRVNFARNDIMDDCPVWAAIVSAIHKHVNAQQTSTESASRSRTSGSTGRTQAPRLTEEDRIRLCNQAKDGNLEGVQFKSIRLFQRWSSDVNLTVRQVANIAKGRVTLYPQQARYPGCFRKLVDQISMNKLACVLDRSVLTRFGLGTGEDIVELVNRVIGAYDRYVLTYVQWGDLVETMKSDCQIIQDEHLNRIEAVVLGVLRLCKADILGSYAGQEFAESQRAFEGGPTVCDVRERRIVLGRGPRDSWTDACSYIAINREIARRMKISPSAWMHYAHLIMHEALHTKPSFKNHKHTKRFYEQFHNWSRTRWRLGNFMYNCTVRTPGIASSVRQRLTEQALREIDRIEAGQEFAESQGDLTAAPAVADAAT